MLTTFLMPIVIGACWSVQVRVKEYMILFLMLETMMLAVFCALDLVLFYVVFEAGLIPMFLIVGIWGGRIESMPPLNSSFILCWARC